MDNRDNALVPYALVHSLSKIDNIFEMRLFGWVLAKAQSVLKLYSRDLAEINMQHAMNMLRVTFPARYLLPPGDRNYKNIEKAFELANKTIDYEKDGARYRLNIIAFPQIKHNGRAMEISFVIHNELWHAILNNFQNGYRLVNLPTFMSLKSTYAAILYIIISQQPRLPDMRIDTLRRIVGASSRAYDRANNFIARVLEPARAELTKFAPYTFDYELTRGGKGNGYQTIRLRPRANYGWQPAREGLSRELERMRLRLDERVTDYLSSKFEMTAREIERAEPFILQLGDFERQMDKLAYVSECAIRARAENRKAYLFAALRG